MKWNSFCTFCRKNESRPAQRTGRLCMLGSKGRWPRFQPDVCSIMCLQSSLQIPKEVTMKCVGLWWLHFLNLKGLEYNMLLILEIPISLSVLTFYRNVLSLATKNGSVNPCSNGSDLHLDRTVGHLGACIH